MIELACAAAFVVLTGMLVVRITRQSRRSGEERAARETMAQIQITMPPAPTNVPLTTEPPNMMFDYAEELLKINSELAGCTSVRARTTPITPRIASTAARIRRA